MNKVYPDAKSALDGILKDNMAYLQEAMIQPHHRPNPALRL